MTSHSVANDRTNSPFPSFPKTHLGRLIFTLVLFALFIDVYAVLCGLNNSVSTKYEPEGYKVFFRVHAWYPFPIYFILIFFVIRQSWDMFNDAWRSLPKTNVLQRRDGKGILDEKRVLDEIIESFEWRRNRWLIPLSLAAGAICMFADSERERDIMIATYSGYQTDVNQILPDTYGETKRSFSGQVARACEDPDFMSKWLWDELAEVEIYATDMCYLEFDKKTNKLLSTTREDKFIERMQYVKRVVAIKRAEEDTYLPPPLRQWVPVMLMHIEDMFLISFAWLIFLQCVAHPMFFWNFERVTAGKHMRNQFRLKLNSQSPMREFGLERWNHALNDLYWYFSAALIIPILSRFSQPNLDDLDFSQSVLQFAIPILVATPMILTILSRQSRLPACWEGLTPEETKNYLEQRLWPLDKNWSSKLGVVLAFVILSVSFGINLAVFL